MIKKIMTIFILILLMINLSFAADGFYRLTHNDHDGLVIGHIETVNDESIVITVEQQIISDMDLNAEQPIQQMNLVGETITINDAGHYSLFELDSTMAPIPAEGDLVLASVNKDGLQFKKMWGLYKLAKEGERYKVLTSAIGAEYYKMDAAALQIFINSDGQINEFSFNGDTKEVYAEGQLIYDGETINEDVVDQSIEETTSEQITDQNKPSENAGDQFFSNQSTIMLIVAGLMAVGIIILRLFNKK